MIPPDILSFLLYTIPALLLGLSMHEFGHAYAAWRLGDREAEHDGRLSLNPFGHLDILWGFLLLISGLWMKPLQAGRLRGGRRAVIVVALAGPAANLVLAWVAHLLVLYLPGHFGNAVGMQLTTFLIKTLQVNLLFAAVNVLPIPPLDGARALSAWLSPKQSTAFDRMETLGIVVLILLIASRYIDAVVYPIANVLHRVIVLP